MPWLTTIGLIPLAGAVAIWLLPLSTGTADADARRRGAPAVVGPAPTPDAPYRRASGDAPPSLAPLIALGTSLVTLVATVAMALRFDVARPASTSSPSRRPGSRSSA